MNQNNRYESYTPTDQNKINLLMKQYPNGRVANVDQRVYPSFPMLSNDNNNNDKFKKIATQGIVQPTALNQLFFSEYNMNRIQDLIRYKVYIQSNKEYVIDRQSDTELEIVMRSIYLQHSQNLNCQFKEQVDFLNKLVVDWSVPQIMSEIQLYQRYLKEVNTLPVPIELPVNLSSKGTRNNRSITTTF
jgi:hypothetical protein